MIEGAGIGLRDDHICLVRAFIIETRDAPGFANVNGFPPAHSFTSKNVSDPVSATRPVSCIRASMMPISPASFPSEYCWYSPCRSYIRYTPSSFSTTSLSSPVQPNRMIFPWSHYTRMLVHAASVQNSSEYPH